MRVQPRRDEASGRELFVSLAVPPLPKLPEEVRAWPEVRSIEPQDGPVTPESPR
jgi:hypothetical protein